MIVGNGMVGHIQKFIDFRACLDCADFKCLDVGLLISESIILFCSCQKIFRCSACDRRPTSIIILFRITLTLSLLVAGRKGLFLT